MNFMAMVWATLFDRHSPVSTMAKPACMNMTRKPVTKVQNMFTAALTPPNDLASDAIHLLHRGTRAHEALKALTVAFAQLSAEVFRLHAQIAAFDGALDGKLERVEVDRFRQVILRPGAHGANCRFYLVLRGR